MKKLFTTIFLFTFFIHASLAVAAFSDTPETPFAGQMSGMYYSMAHNEDTVYAGGGITTITLPGSIAVLDEDKETVRTLPFVLSVAGEIRASVTDSVGNLYIAGGVLSVDGVERGRIIRILADGTFDEDFSVETNDEILTIALLGDTLYAGGLTQQVIAIDTTTGGSTPVGDNITDVRALAIDGTTLYIGGGFLDLEYSIEELDTQYDYLVAFNTGTGELIPSFDPVLDSTVLALATGGGIVYAGGQFDSVNGDTDKNYLVALDSGGDTVSTFDTPSLQGGPVLAIYLDGNTLHVGGAFIAADGVPNNFASFDIATGDVNPLNVEIGGNVESVFAHNGRIYLGHSSTPPLDLTSIKIIDEGTGEFVPFRMDEDTHFMPKSFAAFGNTVYIPTSLAEIPFTRNGLAAWEKDTGNLRLFDIGLDTGGEVYTVFLDGTTLYAGGYFESVKGNSDYAHLAAFNSATGALDEIFNPTLGDTVWSVVKEGTTLYAGGQFAGVGGNADHHSLAALDSATGAVVGNLSPNLNAEVWTMLLDGTTLYVGGSFTNVGGTDEEVETPYDYLVAFDTVSGELISSFAPVFNAEVYTLLLDGTTLYVGGNFTDVGGDSDHTRLAALNTTTGAFVGNISANLGVSNPNTLLLDGTTLYVGGYFESVNGESDYAYFAAFNITTGELISDFKPALSSNGYVLSLQSDEDRLYAVGAFTEVGGASYSGIASFAAENSAPVVDTAPATGVAETTATLHGTITSTGGDVVTERGFEYGETTGYGETTSTSGSYTTGAYTAALSSLTCETTYHYRAFATSTAGTGYGSDQTFTTSRCSSGGSSGGSRPTTPTPTIPAPEAPSTDTSHCRPGDAFSTVTGARCSTTTPTTPTTPITPTTPGVPSTPTPSAPVPPAVKTALSSAPALGLNKTNPSVLALQQYLNAKGYTVSTEGAGAPGKETSFFGAKTKAALIKFQAANGLVADGIFGPMTKAKMLAL